MNGFVCWPVESSHCRSWEWREETLSAVAHRGTRPTIWRIVRAWSCARPPPTFSRTHGFILIGSVGFVATRSERRAPHPPGGSLTKGAVSGGKAATADVRQER